jgi:hypothetical protein
LPESLTDATPASPVVWLIRYAINDGVVWFVENKSPTTMLTVMAAPPSRAIEKVPADVVIRLFTVEVKIAGSAM